MLLRISTSALSLALHAGAVWYALATLNAATLESGSSDDMFAVEQGIAIEGIASLGNDTVTVAAREVEPQEAGLAAAAVEEIKAEEKVEETEIITSDAGPLQEDVTEVKPEPVEQPQPAQAAALEQQPQAAVEEQRAAGRVQTGGSVAERNAYRGAVHAHVRTKAITPQTNLKGRVVIEFVLDAEGELLSIKVRDSSGHKTLDAAAEATIRRAAPFPKMPAALGATSMTLPIPFEYR